MTAKKSLPKRLSLKQIALLLCGEEAEDEIASLESREALSLLCKAVNFSDPDNPNHHYSLKAWLHCMPNENWESLERTANPVYWVKIEGQKAKYFATLDNAYLVKVNQKDFLEFINKINDDYTKISELYDINQFWRRGDISARKKLKTAERNSRWYERAKQIMKDKGVGVLEACEQIAGEENNEYTIGNIHRRVKEAKKKAQQSHSS